MYPYLRTAYHIFKARQKPKLEHPFIESKISMRVWPWDIDPFFELNNGRYLTLMDIGRYEVGERIGLPKVLKENNWGLIVGAVSNRYRNRLKPFEKFTLHTRMHYFDERWFYFHQWFSSNDNTKINASFLVRTAVTSKNGLVPTTEVIDAMDYMVSDFDSHNLKSDWVDQWLESDEIHRHIMENQL